MKGISVVVTGKVLQRCQWIWQRAVAKSQKVRVVNSPVAEGFSGQLLHMVLGLHGGGWGLIGLDRVRLLNGRSHEVSGTLLLR